MSAPSGKPDTFGGRLALEESWRARVRATKLWFEYAASQAAQAAGTPAAERAQALELTAREDYMRALQIFADLVVRGKPPEDETVE